MTSSLFLPTVLLGLLCCRSAAPRGGAAPSTGEGGADGAAPEPVVCPHIAQGEDTAASADGVPVAIIDCPPGREMAYLASIWMDGSPSDDAWPGGSLFYLWTVTGPVPEASFVHQSDKAEIYVGWVGRHLHSLVVTDSRAGASEPATCAVDITAPAGLLVELWWSRPEDPLSSALLDVDLHLLRRDAALEDPDDDCWSETDGHLDWGVPGDDLDDPVNYDQQSAGFPEVARLGALEPGETYTLAVKVNIARGDPPPTSAFLRVWLDGILLTEESAPIDLTDVWTVGRLVDGEWVPDGTIGVELHTGG